MYIRCSEVAPFYLISRVPYNGCMIKTRFGRTGFDVTPLGLGAAEIGYLKPQREQAAKVLNLYSWAEYFPSSVLEQFESDNFRAEGS